MSVCECVVCPRHIGACGGRCAGGRSLGFFQLKLQVVGSCLMWVLEIKFGVSARAVFIQSLSCLSCLWVFEPVSPVGCAG